MVRNFRRQTEFSIFQMIHLQMFAVEGCDGDQLRLTIAIQIAQCHIRCRTALQAGDFPGIGRLGRFHPKNSFVAGR